MAFEEPHVIKAFDRTFNDKHEELRFERGEYQGRPTYTLRLYWQTPEGQWRWSAAKPSSTGRCWQALNLKGRELLELGEAMIAEAKAQGVEQAGPPQAVPRRQSRKAAQADAESNRTPYAGAGHDEDMPF